MTSNDEDKNLLLSKDNDNNNENALNSEDPNNNDKNTNLNVNTDKPQDKKDTEAGGKSIKEQIESTVAQFFIAGLFEFFGMFLFTVAILLGSGPEAGMISFWIIITMISPFSGGHVNPAVTFGAYIYDMELFKGLGKLIMYCIAQLAGCGLAIIFCSELKDPEKIVMFKHPVEKRQFFSEFFFTGTFIFVILYCCSTVTRVSSNRALNCGIIASWLYYASTSAGKISVGALNPAIMSAFAIFNSHLDDSYYATHKKDIWNMIAAHFGSALFFALIFFLAEKMFPDSKINKEENKQKAIEVSK